MLTEPSCLVLRFHIYAGSADRDVGGAGQTGKVVNYLLNDFKNKGHSIFLDNFYNSVDLSTQVDEGVCVLNGMINWYKKIGIHIFQVLLLNSYFLYNKYSRQKINLFDFRHEVIKTLLLVERRQPSAAQK
ncbi:hypothetical protein J437_LFUL011517, partial [Ladona fulva]